MDYEYEIRKIEKYAEEKGVPIMEKDGINFLCEFIKLNKIQNILEIGSAIGYSSIKMALVNENVNITSIEKDKDRYLTAVKNVKKLKLDDRITLILNDALDVKKIKKYDLIFIDAAKSQYIKFFDKFSNNLVQKGYIVTDNINFHGLTFSDKTKLSRNLRGLITKIERYITFLKTNTKFKTRFFDIGDGIAISRKKDTKDEKDSYKDKL